jgi:hypothetical protein
MKRSLLTFLAVIGLAASAQAHAIWIEQEAVYFGEFEENLREKGEKIGRFAGLKAWSIKPDGSKEELNVTAAEDRLNLEGAGANVMAYEAEIPVREQKPMANDTKETPAKSSKVAKPFFYARSADGSVDLKGELKLDIVPDRALSQAQVVFDGAPLADHDVELMAADGKIEKLKTNAEGKVHFNLSAPGVYLLDAVQVVEKPGRFKDKDYEVERHHATLTLFKK